MKRVRMLSTTDPERLTTAELLTAHERVFGPLDPTAKARILRSVYARRWESGSDGMDGLAA